jgi:hypothetical protein
MPAGPVPVKIDPNEVSSNFFWTYGREEVFNIQTTIRADLPPEQFAVHLQCLVAAMKQVVEVKGHAKQVGAGATNGAAKPAPAPIVVSAPAVTSTTVAPPPAAVLVAPAPVSPPPAAHGAPPAPAGPVPAPDGGATPEVSSFRAQVLVGEVKNGTAQWKLKGGRFMQHGVRIWPEVLTAVGINPDTLDPLKQHDMTAWVAFFVTNEKGQPHKVTCLVPAPAPAHS